jgi:transcription antitermination factor NusG
MLMQGVEMTAEITTEIFPWWALYTRHQHEKAVADGLLAKGFEVFLPVYESARHWKDRKKTISIPLFSCYVFVRGGLNRRHQVVTTPGVYSILSCGGQVATIPETEIAAIQRIISGSLRVEPHPFLNCGDRVRVVRGALEGVAGILMRKKSLCRLILSVDTLARSIAVEINASDVEPDVYSASEAITSRQVPGLQTEYQGHGQRVEVHEYKKQPRSVGVEDRPNGIPISA